MLKIEVRRVVTLKGGSDCSGVQRGFWGKILSLDLGIGDLGIFTF